MNPDQQPPSPPSETPQIEPVIDVQTLGTTDQPPSLRAVRPLQISQLSGAIDDEYANGQLPSTLDVRPLTNSQLSGGIDQYDDGSAEPPSSGAVRPLENSQISGAGDDCGSGQPVSIGDLRPLENSQTGIADSNEGAAMSSVAPKFKLRKFHPNIFQRDNNEY